MGSFNYELNFSRLNEVAIEMGYMTSYRKDIKCSRVSHYLKAIELKRESDVETIYAFSHEIGHCYIHTKIEHKTLNEIAAWIVGFGICLGMGVPVNIRFFTLAYESLKTYWIRKN